MPLVIPLVFARNVDNVPSTPALCILDITSDNAFAGDISEEVVRDAAGSRCSSRVVISERRRAGFGDVLKVEPRDVYLVRAR